MRQFTAVRLGEMGRGEHERRRTRLGRNYCAYVFLWFRLCFEGTGEAFSFSYRYAIKKTGENKKTAVACRPDSTENPYTGS